MLRSEARQILDSDRFEIRRRIGAGGFGVVYEAFDRERGAAVALKMLHRLDAAGLYRLKQEFRSLSDIAHENLITLYELLSHADRWFFTMEFVEGSSILRYMQAGSAFAGSDDPTDSVVATTITGPAAAGSATSPPPVAPPSSDLTGRTVACDVGHLRVAVRGLAQGLAAIHRHGIVHQDIKPSNVMVTPAGRVVLMDFGLARNVHRDATVTEHVSGTPAYMSPEQATGRPMSEASDWYSVGVLMYEALTGRLPHTGTFFDLAMAKQTVDPVAPSVFVRGVPADLERLCLDLLSRDPAKRPGIDDVVRRLDAAGGSIAAQPRFVPVARLSRLVGRDGHLAALREAFHASEQGRTVAVMVHGRSGMGKSSLVRTFLGELGGSASAPVILEGRCYEREAMSYKAVDTLIDALAKHLQRLDEVDAARVLPRDILDLARLFPVLREIDVVARTPLRSGDRTDITEVRRRAFVALRDLLGAMADQTPLVLFIDDIQWGDLDSVALLRELLRPPDPPHLLLVLAFRAEERESSALLRALLPSLRELGGTLDLRDVEVGELSPSDAAALALSRLGSSDADRSRAAAIAAESGGSPFFVDELVRHAEAGGEGVELREVIRERLARLPAAARLVLELVAVSGRPVAREVIAAAAGLPNLQAILDLLRVEHLIRTHVATERLEVEAYHDRIREVTSASLSPADTLARHRALAHAWEADGRADPAVLTAHYVATGEKPKASAAALRAADRAAGALAFELAAHFYRLVLDLGVLPADEARDVRARLGEALANDGRGHEAGGEFLAAAEGRSAHETLRFELRAAEQYLMGGSLDAGLAVTNRVLGRVGMKLPATPQRAMVSVLTRRALLKLRGFRFSERAESAIPPELLERLDVCSFLGGPLGMVDPLRGFDLQVKQTLLALRLGEPHRVAWALSNQISNFAITGHRELPTTRAIMRDALALSTRLDDPRLIGRVLVASGIATKLLGEFQESLTFLDRAFETFAGVPGLSWERQTARIFMLEDLMWLGRFIEMQQHVPGYVEAARQRGDLYASSYMRSRYAPIGFLVADDPDGAHAEAERGMMSWSSQGYALQRYYQLHTTVHARLYQGDARGAWALLDASWPTLKRTLLRSIVSTRIDAYQLRGRAALAVVAAGDASKLAVVSDVVKVMGRERLPWSQAFSLTYEGAIAAWRGNRARALSLLEAGERAAESAAIAGFLAAFRRARGTYLGGQDGQALVAAADAWAEAQGARNPVRLTRSLGPSLPA
jgi:hypothetical protein